MLECSGENAFTAVRTSRFMSVSREEDPARVFFFPFLTCLLFRERSGCGTVGSGSGNLGDKGASN